MNKVNLTYKYRLYPTKAQEKQLDFLLWQGRRVWNMALGMRRQAYDDYGVSLHRHRIAKVIGKYHKYDAQMNKLPFDTVTYIIHRVDKAYQAFFRKVKEGVHPSKAGFPHFKKREQFTSLEYRGRGCKIKDSGGRFAQIKLHKLPPMKILYHRPIPEDASIQLIMLKREKNGHWYVNCQIAFEHEMPEHNGYAVGLDVGIASLFTTSEGHLSGNPKWLEIELPKLRRLQRAMARRQRHDKNGKPLAQNLQSRNWHEVKAQVTRLHGKIVRQRRHYYHEITDALTSQYEHIVMEDLTLAFMLKNKRLARLAHGAAIGEFRQMLEYKAKLKGGTVTYVSPHYTSQECSECGHIDKENRKTQASFVCVACGHKENADVNAAKNILTRAVHALHGETQAIGSNVP